MKLSDAQLQSYRRDGYLLLPSVFSPREVEILRGELPGIYAQDLPSRVLEKDGRTVRSVYASHTFNDVYRALSRHPRMVGPAKQILEGEAYVYQFKINAKRAFDGDRWEWHQDYIYWLKEDGMARPLAFTATVFLDDVTEFNGPLCFIPGSHRDGVHDVPARGGAAEDRRQPYLGKPQWIQNLIADLKYTLDRERLATLVRENGMVAPKGPAGSVLLFDANLVHASTGNLSPFDRGLVLVTFNRVDNVPHPTGEPRPDFLVARDHGPVDPGPDDSLLTART